MTIAYTRDEILRLKPARPARDPLRLPVSAFVPLSTTRLLLYCPTRRSHPASAYARAWDVVRRNRSRRREASCSLHADTMSPTTPATKLCLLNACSLQNKEELLADIFYHERPDFLAITETWLTPMHGVSTLTKLCPDGYASTHRPRSGKRGGGVAFMYKNSLQCSSFSSSDYSSFKHLDLLLTIPPRPIHIIIFYRPTVNPLSAFWRIFHNFLTL